MSMELCGDCSKLFDADMSIEAPERFLVPPVPVEGSPNLSLAADVFTVWRCPTCSIGNKVSA